jgi:hypothetical protein
MNGNKTEFTQPIKARKWLDPRSNFGDKVSLSPVVE